MSDFGDKSAKCPFYSKQEGRKIFCEGFAEGCYIQIWFKDNSLLHRHRESFCNSVKGCEGCPIHRVIDERYDKEAKWRNTETERS